MMIFDRQGSRGENRNNYINERYDRSRNRSRESHFLETITTIEIGAQATASPGQDPGQVQTEIG